MARAGIVEIVLSGDMAGLESALQRTEQRLEATASRMRSVGATLAFTVTASLAAIGGGALASSISFEQSVAQMAKTIEASDAVIQGLADGFTELSEQIPVARNELALIAAEAGQLGIAVEQIPSFTRTVADLRVATNLGEAAGTTLARLANIMGDVTPEFDRMGATIVHLGNNAAATEAEIAHMALRIAGAGKVIGLHHPEVLALASGLASVGIQAEAGGTAISRVMVEIANAVASGGDKLTKFAQIAGTSAEEFQTAFRENAAVAVIDFIEGLGKLNEAGVNVFAVLEDVEFQNVRIRDALLRSAGAGDLMRRSLDLGRSAWQENIALTAEAERFYDTTQGRLVILRNRINNVAGELGDVLVPSLLKLMDAADPVIEMLRTMIRMFGELPQGIQTVVIATGALAAVLGPAMLLISGLTSALGAFSGMAATATSGLLALHRLFGVGGLVFSVRSFADATTLARWAIAGLGSVVTPGGVVLVGLGLLVAMLAKARIEAHRTAVAFEDARRRVRDSIQGMTEDTARHTLVRSTQQMSEIAARLAEVQGKIAAERERLDNSLAAKGSGAAPGTISSKLLRQLQKEEQQLKKTVELHKEAAIAAAWRLDETMRARLAAEEAATGTGVDPATYDLGIDVEERAKRIAEAHEDLATALRTAAGMEALLGEAFDANRAIASAYRSTLQTLLSEGVDPADERLQEYAAALLQVETSIKAADEAERARIETERERDRLKADALSVVHAAMTAEERYEQQVRRLTQALEEGLITQEEYNRGVAHLDKELAKATRSLSDTLAEQGVAAGEALIRGLLTGANNMSDILKSAMINLAVTKMMAPLKLALGIASPSKVFRGYGEAIGEGLALGIESSAGMVSRASEMMVAAVRVPNLTPAYSLGAPAPGVAAMAGAGRMDIDPSKLPRPMTPFDVMRDAQWQALLRGSVDVARSQGWR